MIKKVILASKSPRRIDLIREIFPSTPIEIKPSDCRESHPNPSSSLNEVQQIVVENALKKGHSIYSSICHSLADDLPILIISADTLVFQNRTTFGKPSSLEEAKTMLCALSREPHQVITGVSLLWVTECRRLHIRTFFDVTEITFSREICTYTDEQYDALFARMGTPLDKAGAYNIASMPPECIVSVAGSTSNVIGLPLEHIQACLCEPIE